MAYNTTESNRRNSKETWWSGRTAMEKYGIGVLIVAVVLIIVLVIVIAVFLPKKGEENDEQEMSKEDIIKTAEETCNTPECVHAASNILKYVDSSLDPCDDFYKFACGKFLRETVIPDNKMVVNPISIMNGILRQQLKSMIEEPSKPNELKPFILLKKLYNACMNTTAIEADGLKTIMEIVKDLGGWPVLEGSNWKQDKFDWRRSIFKFRKHGLSTDNFISFKILPDPKNSTRRIITLDQAQLELSRENWLNGFQDEIIMAYQEYMVDLATLFGASKEISQYEVKNMIIFKMQLANISLSAEDRRNDKLLYNPMTIEELQNRYRTIPWLELINSVLASHPRVVTREEIVNVHTPSYISSLENLLQETSKRVQANHAIFQAIRSLESFLPENIRNRQHKFESTIYGNPTRTPRWEECIAISSKTFNFAAGALYVRKYFNEKSRQNVKDIVMDIKKEFIKILKKVDWMDEVTKKCAIDKALSMTAHVGYPDELLNDTKLEQFYSGININSDNYLYLISNISVFVFDQVVNQLWEVINKTDWKSHASPITTNAFYILSENSIQIPAAFLQRSFFCKDRLKSMNYGAIGSIIGHEITHGFDDEGKQYDKDGNLRNWWAKTTDNAFKRKAECFVDQYSNYTVPEVGLNINGRNTEGENIADNGGLKEAYLAYQSWVKRNGREPKLPGLNYTAEQLFWISAAHSWCSKIRKESLINSLLTDNHSPPHYRVLIPFKNSIYFSKDFECVEGTNMNPKHKCEVW